MEKRGVSRDCRVDFGMTMVRRLGLYSRWRRGGDRSRVDVGAVRGGDVCGYAHSAPEKGELTTRWRGFGTMRRRCEDGADGVDDKKETRWCGVGDARKKTGKKAHGRKKRLWA